MTPVVGLIERPAPVMENVPAEAPAASTGVMVPAAPVQYTPVG